MPKFNSKLKVKKEKRKADHQKRNGKMIQISQSIVIVESPLMDKW